MTWLDLPLLVLADLGVLFVWFKEQGPFAPWLASLQAQKTLPGFWGWRARLLTCPYCFAYHVAFWLVALLYLPSVLLPEPWGWPFRAILLVPAVARVVGWLVPFAVDDHPSPSPPPAGEPAAAEEKPPSLKETVKELCVGLDRMPFERAAEELSRRLAEKAVELNAGVEKQPQLSPREGSCDGAT